MSQQDVSVDRMSMNVLVNCRRRSRSVRGAASYYEAVDKPLSCLLSVRCSVVPEHLHPARPELDENVSHSLEGLVEQNGSPSCIARRI